MSKIKVFGKKAMVTTLCAATLFSSALIIPAVSNYSSETPFSITADAAVPNGTYRLWSRGTGVKELQISLNSLGFWCGTPDGIYGYNTRNAVINFQRRYGLYADGIAGYMTISKINSLTNTSTVKKLNKNAVLNYANTYWNKRNYNYYYYTNNNCCNFVSQCLVAGGLPTNSTFRNGTSAFVGITYFSSYMQNTLGVKYISRPSASQIDVGDVLYTSSGHVMIVTKKVGNTVYANGNTNNRYQLQISPYYFYAVLKTSALMS